MASRTSVAVVVRDGVIVAEGRNYVVLHSDPTARAELLAVRDAARWLKRRDLSDCDVYSTATRVRCASEPYTGHASAAITTIARLQLALLRSLRTRGQAAPRQRW
jgi:hypothetical protein